MYNSNDRKNTHQIHDSIALEWGQLGVGEKTGNWEGNKGAAVLFMIFPSYEKKSEAHMIRFTLIKSRQIDIAFYLMYYLNFSMFIKSFKLINLWFNFGIQLDIVKCVLKER